MSAQVRPAAWVATLCIVCLLSSAAAVATAQGSAPDSQSASDKSKAAKSESGAPTAQEIAAAKASHKVWVNLNTGIYHRRGRWYGKTKAGKFMTEDEAKKAGYKAAKRE